MLLIPIVGNPVAQVKAPGLLNPRFAEAGLPARMEPVELPVDGFDDAFAAMLARPEVAGVVVTLPFKPNALRHCATLARSARLSGAANLLVRRSGEGWRGAMTDGDGFVAALRAAGCEPAGRRVYLAGSGGAGSGIAAALAEAGAASLNLFDPSPGKAARLAAALGPLIDTTILDAPPVSLAGYGLLINATPLGLRETDPLPFDPATARADAFVGDVVAEPAVSRLRRAAAARGLGSIGGMEMLAGQIEPLFTALGASVRLALTESA